MTIVTAPGDGARKNCYGLGGAERGYVGVCVMPMLSHVRPVDAAFVVLLLTWLAPAGADGALGMFAGTVPPLGLAALLAPPAMLVEAVALVLASGWALWWLGRASDRAAGTG